MEEFNKNLLGVVSPDRKDKRDYLLSSIQPEAVSLPDKFLLRDKMTSIQKQIYGTCTANMSDGLKEFWDSQEYGKEIKLSQRFIYYNTKKISGLWHDQGDYLRNALKSVCDYGACLETSFPDTPDGNWDTYIQKEPLPEGYKEAEQYKGKTYWRIGNTLDNFRQAIYQNQCPVGFGMVWYDSYRGISSDGKLPLPSGDKLGGHALIAIGWEDDKLWIRNSWGTDWGDKGYFYIPFNEFDKHDIWDCWVLLDIQRELKGWMAGEYLKRLIPKFIPNEVVSPIYRLILREQPGIKSNKITVLNPSTKLIILDDINNGISQDGYTWYRVQQKVAD